MCMCVGAGTGVQVHPEDRRGRWVPELELEVVVSVPMWVLGMESGPLSSGAVQTLNL